jgi:hypothetical protein
MNAQERFSLIYAPQVKTHLKAIAKKYHLLIRRAIENQLTFNPDVETRNRKPLKRPVMFKEGWEIRFGPENRFRAFYEVNRDSRQVFIFAVGVKKGSRLFIGKEEIKL